MPGKEHHSMTDVIDSSRIERSIPITAPRERVWRALTNAEEFGAWFGADLSGQSFSPGVRTRGPMTMPGCEGLFFDAVTERIEPQELLSFHWHPYSGEPVPDYTGEEPTLVTFTLKDGPGKGVLLTVVESGFDKVPAHRRRKAFEMHEEGWAFQLPNVARHAGN
jgi:uncharacterized protein YndB with AHSA1/START domain